MTRFAQIGIAIGALGIVLTMMGLFPGVMGLTPARGIGTVQIAIILTGFLLLIIGALVYAKYAFYANQPGTLAQQIGVRLALTGLVLGGLVGLADTLGFGSHPPDAETDTYFGWLQASGVVIGFIIASIGVLVYAISGRTDDKHNE